MNESKETTEGAKLAASLDGLIESLDRFRRELERANKSEGQ